MNTYTIAEMHGHKKKRTYTSRGTHAQAETQYTSRETGALAEVLRVHIQTLSVSLEEALRVRKQKLSVYTSRSPQ